MGKALVGRPVLWQLLGIEVLAHRYFILEVAFGIELAYVCFDHHRLIATTIGVIAYEKTIGPPNSESAPVQGSMEYPRV